ncbi:MAG: tetratricopeptide repeat protein, partial [Limisphaerales bacterium]
MTNPPFLNGRLRSIVLGLMAAGAAALRPVSAATPGPASDARWLAAPVAEVRAAAEKGEAAAQHALGERLLRGRDGKPNMLEAYRWTERAAAQQVVEAQLRLGVRHELGIGCLIELELAREWYERAAAKGETGACLGMARVKSSLRIGAEHDGAASLRWLRKAAAGGEFEALWSLAVALESSPFNRGPLVVVERWKAIETLALAGVPSAQEEIGNAHTDNMMGFTSSEPEKAVYWFRLALREGSNPQLQGKADRLARTLTSENLADINRRVADFKPAPPRQLTPLVQSALFLDGPRPPKCASPECVTGLTQTRQRAENGSAAD